MCYKCKECGEKFDYISDLGSHLIYAEAEGYIKEENGKYTFGCVKCDVVFDDESDLHKHLIFDEGFGESNEEETSCSDEV